MAQNREAPAYQEYAAQMMAKTQFRVLSLQERGLLFTLRLECWVNHKLPADSSILARVLGFEATEIEDALPQVLPFFASDGADITCPELDDYRAHLDGRREKLSEAGKRGAAKTNQKHAEVEAATPAATPQPRRGPLVQPSSVKHSQDQQSQDSVLNDVELDREWVNDYARASRGG
jgi:uncharacterized protein YdaU (DUF1376 family)